MLKIIGDGSFNNTVITQDGEVLEYDYCEIRLKPDDVPTVSKHLEGSFAVVWITGKEESILDKMELIDIGGLYKLIGDGSFYGTKLFYNDIDVRGIQNLTVIIKRGVFGESNHTMLYFNSVFLPNLVEIDDVDN